MSTITLHANNPAQVASASFFESFVGVPAKRLLIFSGIAVPAIEVDDDDDIYRDEVIVRLGQFATVLHSSVTNVALASVSNDESAFVFAVDAGKLELDASGELILKVNTAAMGDDSALNRFSYQIVAHTSRVSARISGTIRVPRDIRDVCAEADQDWPGVRSLSKMMTSVSVAWVCSMSSSSLPLPI